MRRRVGVVMVAGALLAVATAGVGAPLESAREAAASFARSKLALELALPYVVRPGLSDADEQAMLRRLARDGASLLRTLPYPPELTALPFTIERAVAAVPSASDPRSVLIAAYRAAVHSAPASCHVPLTLLAAIGQVESGSIGGRALYGHRVTPAIFGPMLTGGVFAAIRDSDGGRLDGSSVWDRAVGPMQFIPGTWARYGVDGDDDGIADPQNLFDAAASAAAYLCQGHRDLSRGADLRQAILSYNASSQYLASVLQWMTYFQVHGLGAISTVSYAVASGTGTALPSTASPVDPPPATPPKLPAPLVENTGTEAASSSTATGSTPSATTSGTSSSTSTSDPTTTTSDPSTTTSDPTTTTTSDPTTTTSDPSTTTSDPTTTTSAPTTTTSDPSTTTSDPTTTTTSDPSTTTSDPTTTTSDPTTTSAPSAGTSTTAESTPSASDPTSATTSDAGTATAEPTTTASSG